MLSVFKICLSHYGSIWWGVVIVMAAAMFSWQFDLSSTATYDKWCIHGIINLLGLDGNMIDIGLLTTCLLLLSSEEDI